MEKKFMLKFKKKFGCWRLLPLIAFINQRKKKERKGWRKECTIKHCESISKKIHQMRNRSLRIGTLTSKVTKKRKRIES